jgi:hypothetical protein
MENLFAVGSYSMESKEQSQAGEPWVNTGSERGWTVMHLHSHEVKRNDSVEHVVAHHGHLAEDARFIQ